MTARAAADTGFGKDFRLGPPQKPYENIRKGPLVALKRSLRFRSAVLDGTGDERGTVYAFRSVRPAIPPADVVGVVGGNGVRKSTRSLGAGHVGAPLALTFIEKGFTVLGFDVDAKDQR